MEPAALALTIPLVVAAALAAAKPLRPRLVDDVASIATAAAVLVLCVIVLVRSGDHTLVTWAGDWRPRDGLAIGIALVADPFSAGAAAFAAALALAAFIFAVPYIDDPEEDLFHALMLVFLAAIVGFCFAGDLFTMFVFFELMSIAAFVLAGYQIEQRAPLEGSLNFAIVSSVGSFFMLTGIALVYGRTGALNLAQIGESLTRHSPDALVAVAFALLACALFVKAAIVPFHFWLADAYAVARTPVCIMFAGVMSELGLYGLARVYWTAFSGALGPSEEALRITLVAIGLITAAVGAVMALAQTHLKRLLAFVTIAYLGLFLVGVGMLNADALAGAALFVVGDGFVKGALFVGVGIVQLLLGHVEERPLHGRGRGLRPTGSMFALAALAVASLPPFGAFVGKSLLEHGATEAGWGWVVPVFIAVSAVCAAALLRAGARVFLGAGCPAREAPGGEADEGGEEPGHQGRASLSMLAPMALLLLASLAVGVWPDLAHSTVAAAERFIDRNAYAGAVLHGTRAVSPEPPASPIPEWYDWIYAAISVALALAAAAALVRRPNPADALPPSARRPLSALRALHSGRPGDYVAFTVAGTALIGLVFALAFG